MYDFTKHKLILGVLYSKGFDMSFVYQFLRQRFGRIDYESDVIDFYFTNYYRAEMGSDIKRLFISFSDLVSPDMLPEIKVETNNIEEKFAVEGNRKVNLDPGLLSLSRLILASTKDHAHRIPLRKGIYAEVTLIYKNKEFRPLEWTYPDYATSGYREIFQTMRKKYKEQLSSGKHIERLD